MPWNLTTRISRASMVFVFSALVYLAGALMPSQVSNAQTCPCFKISEIVSFCKSGNKKIIYSNKVHKLTSSIYERTIEIECYKVVLRGSKKPKFVSRTYTTQGRFTKWPTKYRCVHGCGKCWKVEFCDYQLGLGRRGCQPVKHFRDGRRAKKGAQGRIIHATEHRMVFVQYRACRSAIDGAKSRLGKNGN